MAAVDQAAGAFQILPHAVRVDEHGFDELRGFGQQVIREDGGVGKDYAFDGGVGDVAFVPEDYVFETGLSVGADYAGETADLFAGDGVPLVGHGGGALLFFGKEFFGFADFGALQVADFCGDFIEGGGDDGERGEIGGVAVALNDLAADGGGVKAQTGADFFFQSRS